MCASSILDKAGMEKRLTAEEIIKNDQDRRENELLN
jgi:hypothetical protein